MSVSAKHVLLTGLPGVGKTTLIKKTYEALKAENAYSINGFYTEEIRNASGSRIGFDVVTLDDQRKRLARTVEHIKPGDLKRYKVGQYIVFPNEFESIALSLLQKDNDIIILDEIGKMELFSEKFKEMVTNAFKDSSKIILATIPVAKGKPIPLVESIRNDRNSHVITVDKSNRNKLLHEVIDYIKGCLK